MSETIPFLHIPSTAGEAEEKDLLQFLWEVG